MTCTSSSSTWTSSGQYPTGTPPTEESGPLAEIAPLTGYEPNFFDDFHHSETTEIFFQEQSSDTLPSYLLDAEISDETVGRALSSPLFVQERKEPADRRQAYHSPDESLLSCQSLSVSHARTGRPVRCRVKPSRDSENEQIRLLLERHKEQILADFRAEIQKHQVRWPHGKRQLSCQHVYAWLCVRPLASMHLHCANISHARHCFEYGGPIWQSLVHEHDFQRTSSHVTFVAQQRSLPSLEAPCRGAPLFCRCVAALLPNDDSSLPF